MSKSLPERLREASTEATARCFDVSATVCALRGCIADIDVCDAISVQSECTSVSCDGMCLCKMLDMIADEIELDYVRIPEFKYEASRDAFIRYMEFIREENVVTCVKEKCSHQPWDGVFGSQPSRTFEITISSKPGRDTLEKIYEDSNMDLDDYCRKYRHASFSHGDMTRDLLRRQREVLGRDADEREERTCRNTCALYGDFTCSECGYKAIGEVAYCPSCGAKVVKR